MHQNDCSCQECTQEMCCHCCESYQSIGSQECCGCSERSCECEREGDAVEHKAHELKETVKKAKEWLLKEKIKQRLEMRIGKKLDAIADVAVEMMVQKMESKQKKSMAKQELEERLRQAMQS